GAVGSGEPSSAHRLVPRGREGAGSGISPGEGAAGARQDAARRWWSERVWNRRSPETRDSVRRGMVAGERDRGEGMEGASPRAVGTTHKRCTGSGAAPGGLSTGGRLTKASVGERRARREG